MTISGRTKVAAVIGDPVEHSRSPAMLNAAFAAAQLDAVMIPMHVAPADFTAALHGLRAMRALGASVTMPHKLAALAACDDLSADARAIGAVNCVHVDGGRLVGHNTDSGGFADALADAGFGARGERAVVLGGGGAARAVAHALRGMDEVVVVARDPGKVAWTRARPWDELAALLPEAELVVDCTSIGFDPAAPHGVPLDRIPVAALVASLVYHAQPRLLAEASARGHRILDGRGMLAHQAARAFAIWTGRPTPVDVLHAALARSLQS